MDIINLGISDKEELIKLDRECFSSGHWDDELWDIIFNDLDKNIIYGIKDEGKIIAYLMIYNWGSEKNYVKITNMAVLEKYRNIGLAKKLMKKMLDDMKGLGMSDFRGGTRVSNVAMQEVFINFGFKNTELIENYYDSPEENALKYILVF